MLSADWITLFLIQGTILVATFYPDDCAVVNL